METYSIERNVHAFVNDNLNYSDHFLDQDLSNTPVQIGSESKTLYGWNIYNPNDAIVFVKLYNKASSPNVGTDIPVLTIPVLLNVVFFGSDQYKYFDLGMWAVCVTGYLHTDNTAPSIGVFTQIQYK
jgi:hypothetical protein